MFFAMVAPLLGLLVLVAILGTMSGPKVEQSPAEELQPAVEELQPAVEELLPPPTVEEQCSAESNVDLEELASADELDFLNNHDFRCYEKCLAVKHGLVEDNGDPVIDAFSNKFAVENKTTLEEYIIQCSIRNQRPDICDQVYYTSMCIGKFSII